MTTQNDSITGYDTGTVRSADGTTIGYRRIGSGPAVLLVHGGMQASQHLMKLGRAMSQTFTVYLPDRRGRGLSGPHGDEFGIMREVEDIQALAETAGASRVFGLSAGALVTLRAALATPAFDRIALYEPPLSVNNSAPVAWVDRFDREIAAGKSASALVTALKGLGTEPTFARFPRFALVPLLAVGTRFQGDPPSGDVPIMRLIPTQHFDMRLVREMAGTLGDYAALPAQVLLLGGTSGPAYLRTALDALAATLPHARRITFDGLDHSGPDDDGDPERVGAALQDFFA